MIITDTESADVPTPTGPMRTYLFRPVAEGRYPGLVLYSEIFQVTGPIRRADTAGTGAEKKIQTWPPLPDCERSR